MPKSFDETIQVNRDNSELSGLRDLLVGAIKNSTSTTTVKVKSDGIDKTSKQMQGLTKEINKTNDAVSSLIDDIDAIAGRFNRSLKLSKSAAESYGKTIAQNFDSVIQKIEKQTEEFTSGRGETMKNPFTFKAVNPNNLMSLSARQQLEAERLTQAALSNGEKQSVKQQSNIENRVRQIQQLFSYERRLESDLKKVEPRELSSEKDLMDYIEDKKEVVRVRRIIGNLDKDIVSSNGGSILSPSDQKKYYAAAEAEVSDLLAKVREEVFKDVFNGVTSKVGAATPKQSKSVKPFADQLVGLNDRSYTQAYLKESASRRYAPKRENDPVTVSEIEQAGVTIQSLQNALSSFLYTAKNAKETPNDINTAFNQYKQLVLLGGQNLKAKDYFDNQGDAGIVAQMQWLSQLEQSASSVAGVRSELLKLAESYSDVSELQVQSGETDEFYSKQLRSVQSLLINLTLLQNKIGSIQEAMPKNIRIGGLDTILTGLLSEIEAKKGVLNPLESALKDAKVGKFAPPPEEKKEEKQAETKPEEEQPKKRRRGRPRKEPASLPPPEEEQEAEKPKSTRRTKKETEAQDKIVEEKQAETAAREANRAAIEGEKKAQEELNEKTGESKPVQQGQAGQTAEQNAAGLEREASAAGAAADANRALGDAREQANGTSSGQADKQEQEEKIKLLGTLEEVEAAYLKMKEAKETYEKAKATKESFADAGHGPLINERRRRAEEAFNNSIQPYQEAFMEFSTFFTSKEDLQAWSQMYDATHVQQAAQEEQDAVIRSQAAIRAEIEETNRIIAEQEEYFHEVKRVNDEEIAVFGHKNKRRALKEVKDTSAEYQEYKENPEAFSPLEQGRRVFRYINAGRNALSIGVDKEEVAKYFTDMGVSDINEMLKPLTDERRRRAEILSQARDRLEELNKELAKTEIPRLSEKLGTTVRKEQNKVNREIKAFQQGVLDTQSHENQKLILETNENKQRTQASQYIDFKSTAEYEQLDEKAKALVDNLISAHMKLEMIKKDGGLEYLQLLDREKTLSDQILDTKEKISEIQDRIDSGKGTQEDVDALNTQKEILNGLIAELEKFDQDKAKAYGIFGLSGHESGTGDIQRQIDSLVEIRNNIDTAIEKLSSAPAQAVPQETGEQAVRTIEQVKRELASCREELAKFSGQPTDEAFGNLTQRAKDLEAELENLARTGDAVAKFTRSIPDFEDGISLESLEENEGLYRSLLDQVREGAMSAEDAIKQMNDALVESAKKRGEPYATNGMPNQDRFLASTINGYAEYLKDIAGGSELGSLSFIKDLDQKDLFQILDMVQKINEAFRQGKLDAEGFVEGIGNLDGVDWAKNYARFLTRDDRYGHGARYLDEAPEGWKKLDGALTAPQGYEWWTNGASRFSNEYQAALVKIKEETEAVAEENERVAETAQGAQRAMTGIEEIAANNARTINSIADAAREQQDMSDKLKASLSPYSEQEQSAILAFMNALKNKLKENYDEARALSAAIELIGKIKAGDIASLMGRFHNGNNASNAMLSKMTGMPVNNQEARNAALESLNPAEYKRIIDEQTAAAEEELQNKKTEFQKKWEELVSAMMGGDAFDGQSNLEKGKALKALSPDIIHQINKSFLAGELDGKSFKDKYMQQYLDFLRMQKDIAEENRTADMTMMTKDEHGNFVAITQAEVDAMHQKAAAYDELIAKMMEYYGIQKRVEQKQPDETPVSITPNGSDQEALTRAYADADEYLARENAYLEERNRLLAEGKAQAQAVADAARQEAEEYEKTWLANEGPFRAGQISKFVAESDQIFAKYGKVSTDIPDEWKDFLTQIGNGALSANEALVKLEETLKNLSGQKPPQTPPTPPQPPKNPGGSGNGQPGGGSNPPGGNGPGGNTPPPQPSNPPQGDRSIIGRRRQYDQYGILTGWEDSYTDSIGNVWTHGQRLNRKTNQLEYYEKDATTYTQLEAEAVKVTNQLTDAQNALTLAQKKGADTRILDAIQKRIDLLTAQKEKIDQYAADYIANHIDPRYPYSQKLYEDRVKEKTDMYSAKAGVRQAEQIVAEEEAKAKAIDQTNGYLIKQGQIADNIMAKEVRTRDDIPADTLDTLETLYADINAKLSGAKGTENLTDTFKAQLEADISNFKTQVDIMKREREVALRLTGSSPEKARATITTDMNKLMNQMKELPADTKDLQDRLQALMDSFSRSTDNSSSYIKGVNQQVGTIQKEFQQRENDVKYQKSVEKTVSQYEDAVDKVAKINAQIDFGNGKNENQLLDQLEAAEREAEALKQQLIDVHSLIEGKGTAEWRNGIKDRVAAADEAYYDPTKASAYKDAVAADTAAKDKQKQDNINALEKAVTTYEESLRKLAIAQANLDFSTGAGEDKLIKLREALAKAQQGANEAAEALNKMQTTIDSIPIGGDLYKRVQDARNLGRDVKQADEYKSRETAYTNAQEDTAKAESLAKVRQAYAELSKEIFDYIQNISTMTDAEKQALAARLDNAQESLKEIKKNELEAGHINEDELNTLLSDLDGDRLNKAQDVFADLGDRYIKSLNDLEKKMGEVNPALKERFDAIKNTIQQAFAFDDKGNLVNAFVFDDKGNLVNDDSIESIIKTVNKLLNIDVSKSGISELVKKNGILNEIDKFAETLPEATSLPFKNMSTEMIGEFNRITAGVQGLKQKIIDGVVVTDQDLKDARSAIKAYERDWNRLAKGFGKDSLAGKGSVVKNLIPTGENGKATTEDVKNWITKNGRELIGDITSEGDGRVFRFQVKDEASGELQNIILKLRETDGQYVETRDKMNQGFGSQAFQALTSSVAQYISMAFSAYRVTSKVINGFKQGFQTLQEYNKALTTISYTMDLTSEQLSNMGQSAIEMAKDLKMSLSDTMQIYQIYANMQTSPEEIRETAMPTAILSNLSGVDAATAADQIQGVIQQFRLLEDTEQSAADVGMHIVDVYDKISANIALDYSKGIKSIADAVQKTGSEALQAGLSFEQLAAIVAKVAERTRAEGSEIGAAIRTLTVRLSKVGKMPGYADEVSNEELSNASKSLHQIGIEVYDAQGNFREFDTIIGELADKWDLLNDA